MDARNVDKSDAESYIAHIMRMHAERVRMLREEELAINVRVALLESLTNRLLCGELLTRSHTCAGLSSEQQQQQQQQRDTAVGHHLSSALPSCLQKCKEGSVEVAAQVEPHGTSAREVVVDDCHSSTTSSPMRRELDEFFPVKVAKRSRRGSLSRESRECRKGAKLDDVGVGRALTATDILADIPCLSSTSIPPGVRVLAAPSVEEKPQSHKRSIRHRQRDYAADEALHKGYDGGADGDDADKTCTPPPYWDIAFPRTR